ncbi:ROK family protein [Clostridium sp. AM58-1XD]|nr:ROK family protein [Clostridium sp. AM58-1XD]
MRMIGSSGLVSAYRHSYRATGQPSPTKILSCTGLSISSFSDYFKYPCRFIHDAECAAMTDLWQNPDLENSVYLSIGKHLGSTVIIGGDFHTGDSGKSGIIEHMILVPGGRPCYCGKKGCVESYCSLTALLEGRDTLDGFFMQKRAGSPEYEKRFHEFLDHLADAVHNVRMVIDIPVILGGPLSPYLEPQDFDYLASSVKSQEILPLSDKQIRQGSKLPHMISVGAALPYVREFLASI